MSPRSRREEAEGGDSEAARDGASSDDRVSFTEVMDHSILLEAGVYATSGFEC
jgi:hypothetical protein